MKQRVITHPDFVIRSPETVIEENALLFAQFLLGADLCLRGPKPLGKRKQFAFNI
jgi:hypothetical protein